jgi:hypothetical protein
VIGTKAWNCCSWSSEDCAWILITIGLGKTFAFIGNDNYLVCNGDSRDI